MRVNTPPTTGMNTPHSQGSRPGDVRGKRGFILSGIAGSHTLFHAFQHSLLVLFPNIRESFALSNLQTTSISAVQEVVAGVIDLPGGVAMDLLKRNWGLVMTLCMGVFGIGWLVVGMAPGYLVVLCGMAIVAACVLPLASAGHGGSLQPLCGTPRLCPVGVRGGRQCGRDPGAGHHRLAVGDAYLAKHHQHLCPASPAPDVSGLLGFSGYRRAAARLPGGSRHMAGLSDQLGYTRQMLRNGVLWGIIAVAGLRGMAFVAFTAVIALYAKDVLDLSDLTRGYYFSLLGLVGMAASPVLGHLSDRFGRKTVLVPNLLALGVLTLLMGWYGHLGAFPVLLVLMGVFLYTDQPVLTAAALDVAGRRTTTTAIGFVSFLPAGLERSFSGDCGVAVPSRGRACGVLLHRGTFLPGRLRSLSAPLAQGMTDRAGPGKITTQ